MNVFTFVVAGSIVGSLAYAAHQGRPVSAQPDGAAMRSITPEGLVLGQRPKGHTMAALGGGGECTIGEPLNWFTAVHFVPNNSSCSNWFQQLEGIGGANGAAGDIDRDGAPDRLALIKDGSFVVEGQFSTYRLGSVVGGTLVKWTTRLVDGELQADYRSVVSASVTQQMRDVFCSLACGVDCQCDLNQFWVQIRGLVDVDGDGDLDLVIGDDSTVTYALGGEFLSSTGPLGGFIWLENTTAADPPLAADINQDGVVDGKDLASVLAAWTP